MVQEGSFGVKSEGMYMVNRSKLEYRIYNHDRPRKRADSFENDDVDRNVEESVSLGLSRSFSSEYCGGESKNVSPSFSGTRGGRFSR